MTGEGEDRLWPPDRRSAAPAVHATLRVEPDTARPGETIRVWVEPIGDFETIRGEALFMRPLEGTTATKDAQTYVLVGVGAGEDRSPRVYGPGETWEVNDIGIMGSHPAQFVLPAAATVQRYRLAVTVAVWPRDDYEEKQTEVVETILAVV